MYLRVIDGKIDYYSGFTWSGSGQFAGKEELEEYLIDFSKQLDLNGYL